jgi:zinc protease
VNPTTGNRESPPKARDLLAPPFFGFTLPAPTVKKLSNGVTVIVINDQRAPLVTFQILLRGAGRHNDPAGSPGIADAVMASLQRIVESQPRAEVVARAGAELSASVGDADAVVTGSSLVESFPAIFQIASAAVSRGEIAREAFERQLPRTPPTQRGGVARTHAAEILAQLVFNGLYNADASASGALSHDLAVRFYRERYVPAETFVGVLGDLSAADAVRIVEQGLGAWQAAEAVRQERVTQAARLASRSVIVPSRQSPQSRFTIGAATCDRRHRDFPALEVLNAVIGRPGSGRMFTSLREQKGYSYFPESELSADIRPLWRAFLPVRPEVAEIALRDMLAEVDLVRKELVPSAELVSKKRALMAELPFRLDRPSGLLDVQLRRVMEDLPGNYWDGYMRRIDLVTSEDVRTVAQKYLNPNRLFVVAVGDPTIIEPALAKVGFAVESKIVNENPPRQLDEYRVVC